MVLVVLVLETATLGTHACRHACVKRVLKQGTKQTLARCRVGKLMAQKQSVAYEVGSLLVGC